MITVKEVSSKSGLRTFVKFPFKLYEDSKYWVPPIISEEVKTFNKEKNPVFKKTNHITRSATSQRSKKVSTELTFIGFTV